MQPRQLFIDAGGFARSPSACPLKAVVATRRRGWRERLTVDRVLVHGWTIADGPLAPQVAVQVRRNGAPSVRCARAFERAARHLDAGNPAAAAKALRANYWFRRTAPGDVRARFAAAVARLGGATPIERALGFVLRAERAVKRRASRLVKALDRRR